MYYASLRGAEILTGKPEASWFGQKPQVTGWYFPPDRISDGGGASMVLRKKPEKATAYVLLDNALL